MARPSLNRATGVGIATNNPDQSPSSGTGRAVLNVRLNGPGRRTRGIEVSPVRPALPKLLRTSRTAVDPQGQCECRGHLGSVRNPVTSFVLLVARESLDLSR